MLAFRVELSRELFKIIIEGQHHIAFEKNIIFKYNIFFIRT